MSFKYVQVSISLNGKVLGNIRFKPGEGSKQHYIRRAKVLSKPYLSQSEENVKLDFKVFISQSPKVRLEEIYIPTFD